MRLIFLTLFLLISMMIKAQTDSVQVQPSTSVGTIYISRDNGTSWSRSDAGFPVDDVVNAWIVKGDLIFAGTDTHGVMISSDLGKSWSVSRRGLPPSVRVTAVVGSGEAILAGTFEHGIFISRDDGSSWNAFNSGIHNLTVRAFHDIKGDLYAGTNNGVYLLERGNQWKKLAGDYQVNDFAADDKFVYVATHLGVVRTSDRGLSWEKVYRNGAIFKINIDGRQVCLLDHFGNVFYSNADQMVWLKDEKYLPIKHSYRLTPTSQQILIPDARVPRIMLNQPSIGLPSNGHFNNLLKTPFGLFASAARLKGC